MKKEKIIEKKKKGYKKPAEKITEVNIYTGVYS